MFSFVSFISVKLQLCPGQLYIVKEYNLVQQRFDDFDDVGDGAILFDVQGYISWRCHFDWRPGIYFLKGLTAWIVEHNP